MTSILTDIFDDKTLLNAEIFEQEGYKHYKELQLFEKEIYNYLDNIPAGEPNVHTFGVRKAYLTARVHFWHECKKVRIDCKLIYMISGDIAVSIEDNKPFHLSVGNLLFIPAGVKYKLKGQYLNAVVINFDPTADWADVAEKLSPVSPENFDEGKCHTGDFSPFDKVIKLDDMESECDNFIKMDSIATSAEGEWRATVSAMLKLVLLKVAESVSENALPSSMVESLDAYIRENCSEEISNTEIGAIFGYHPFYVSNKLKECKGTTLRQYIINYRMKLAKRLLELTDKSVGEIAEETGFKDASYFTKSFKASLGMTPKDYRNEFKDNFI